MLEAMEEHLPVPNDVKTKRGRESPIRVVDLVFASGDARKSVQTIAFNLPNDERVRKEKGAKKVLLRNVIEKKFDVILRPIAQEIIVASQQPNLSASAFFHQVLFHELSHSLGPAMVKKGGKEIEVRQALENTYSAIEECKADVMGAYNLLYMIERKEFPASFERQLLTSYFAGLFRSVRFGVAEAHGKGAADVAPTCDQIESGHGCSGSLAQQRLRQHRQLQGNPEFPGQFQRLVVAALTQP